MGKVIFCVKIPNHYLSFWQVREWPKIPGGGIFENFSASGGILPEVSNFDRQSRLLALLSHN